MKTHVPEAFPACRPQNLRAAFLHFATADEEKRMNFAALTRYADTYQWRFPNLVHRDFAAEAIAGHQQAASDPLQLLTLNLEAYPRLADTWFWLANAHLSRADTVKVREAPSRALEIDPGHARTLRSREKLHAAGDPSRQARGVLNLQVEKR